MTALLTSGRARWQASSYRKAASQSAPSPCGSGLARDGSATDFKPELAGKPAPTEKHRNLPPPPVGAGLPAMAAPLVSRQSSLASQLLQTSTVTRPSFCGSGLARDDGAADFRQSSLASQLLQKASQSVPSPCGSGLARDGSATDFKPKLAGKPAPTEKHRNPPLPLWERACPRWQRCCLQGRARWQASSYRQAQ